MKLNKKSYVLGILTVGLCYVAFLLGVQAKAFVDDYVDFRVHTMVFDLRDGIYEDLATLHPNRVHAHRGRWYVR